MEQRRATKAPPQPEREEVSLSDPFLGSIVCVSSPWLTSDSTKTRLDFTDRPSTVSNMNYLLLALLTLWIPFCQAQDTNPAGRLPATPPPAPTNAPVATSSDEEIITAQGIQIWKKGKPKKAYRTLGFDKLERQKGFPAAENKIARGVLARKGNAAIVNTIQNSMRANFDNTQDERLDGIDIRYEIILLQP
jgi:hypothetical protein